jgi:hypothetical protein
MVTLAHVGVHQKGSLDTGCHAHWLPLFSVEGCFGASKQVMKIFLSFHQAKNGRLDKQ